MTSNIKRQFSFDDQIVFANLSGDYNPLHIDPIIARRLIYGGLVVHGIHALLWALDNCLKGCTEPLYLRAIKAEFRRPIEAGEEVSCFLKNQNKNHIEIELLTKGAVALWMEVDWEFSKQTEFGKSLRKSPGRGICKKLSPDEVLTASGSLDMYLDLELLAKQFPNLVRVVPAMQLTEILATTRLVGMECPGLNSVYYGLDIVFSDKAKVSHELNWEVTSFDAHFRSLQMNIETLGMKGLIKSFFRPEPQKQVSIESLCEQVKNDEFVEQDALIIGGSRGLGEVTSKLLAAGGAGVKITYHRGEEDAKRIVEEIISHGGHASCAAFDVLNPQRNLSEIFGKKWSPTHLYYFATPFISDAVRGRFSSELFQKFLDYYVTGFLKTVEMICTSGSNLQTIFYPSSVYVDEIPLNMGEYAAAKMAGEMLCSFLEKSNPSIKIYKPRLPRTATDQTVSFLPVNNVDPVTLMLENLRNMREIFSDCRAGN